jgi:hypothetical protein
MKILSLVIFALSFFSTVTSQEPQPPVSPAAPSGHITVTAAQMNGIYRDQGGSEFRIFALEGNKVKVRFEGMYMTRAGYPNMGYAMGEAEIDGNIASFTPAETHGCELMLVFLKNKLRVYQTDDNSDCGFGHNVSATGVYRKVKSGKPKFPPFPQ